MKKDKVRFSAIGRVRGSCGHLHRTYKAAASCCWKDHQKANRLPGRCYSDRVVHAVRKDGSVILDYDYSAIAEIYRED